MALSITPISQSGAVQAVTLAAALQPGTVVTAQVLKLLDANLVRLAIANLTLDVVTTMPLQAGQTLQFAVTQGKNGISLAPVLPEPTPALRGGAVVLDDILLAPKSLARADAVRPVLSPEETRAVSAAAQTAVTKQTGLSPLFANLTSAVASGNLPCPVLLAAAQVLALRQPSERPLTGAAIMAALASSGLMLESSVAAGASPLASPDLKAALLVLRQTLATWTAGSAAETAPQIPPPAAPASGAAQGSNGMALKAASPGSANAVPTAPLAAGPTEPDRAALLVTAKNPAMPQQAADLSGNAQGSAALPSRNLLTPPPFRDASPSAQPVAAPSLASDAEPAVVAQHLLADADGALARQTLLQIASLPDRVDMTLSRAETLQPRWNFEIPFVTPQGTAMAQFEIARDGSGSETEAARRVWRARFSLDIEPAGPIHALISFSGDTTSVKMWAERPATAAQLRANARQLGASLDRAALKTADIIVADGAPARTQAPAGHFLNRAS